uniref:Uncharacterized protein n=1 Tax=Rhizophora mucronata TaxID=61149 RepID=A0A2P2NVA0_RHIMU
MNQKSSGFHFSCYWELICLLFSLLSPPLKPAQRISKEIIFLLHYRFSVTKQRINP